MKKVYATSSAPSAIGPYSQAVQAGDVVFVSGQLPIDPATGEFAGADIASQTRQSLTNIKAILEMRCTAHFSQGISRREPHLRWQPFPRGRWSRSRRLHTAGSNQANNNRQEQGSS